MLSGNGDKNLERKLRLDRRLGEHSQEIERVFADNDVDAQVIGGYVNGGSYGFDLRTQVSVGIERVLGLAHELRRTLRVPDVSVRFDRGAVQLVIDRAEVPGVSLLRMVPLLDELPPATAVLGMSEDGRPVLLDFSEHDVTNVLISGEQGAGKTSLIRTLALSLALLNRQSYVQLILLASSESTSLSSLEPLSYLPHMLASVAYGAEDGLQILTILNDEIEHRRRAEISEPAMVVLVDDATDLMETGGNPLAEAVGGVLQHGAAYGIHVVLSTNRPDAQEFDPLLRSTLPVRLVGRQATERLANLAAGISAPEAIDLQGGGEFLAVLDGKLCARFQAAFVDDDELYDCIDQLQRRRPRPLLAMPAGRRSIAGVSGATDGARAAQVKQFRFDGESITFDSDENGDDTAMVDEEPSPDAEDILWED